MKYSFYILLSILIFSCSSKKNTIVCKNEVKIQKISKAYQKPYHYKSLSQKKIKKIENKKGGHGKIVKKENQKNDLVYNTQEKSKLVHSFIKESKKNNVIKNKNRIKGILNNEVSFLSKSLIFFANVLFFVGFLAMISVGSFQIYFIAAAIFFVLYAMIIFDLEAIAKAIILLGSIASIIIGLLKLSFILPEISIILLLLGIYFLILLLIS